MNNRADTGETLAVQAVLEEVLEQAALYRPLPDASPAGLAASATEYVADDHPVVLPARPEAEPIS